MRRPLFFACVCVIFLMAVLRFTFGKKVSSYQEGYISISGRVCDKNDYSITVKSSDCKFLCDVKDAGEIKLGSRITVEGTFSPFEHAANEGEFDRAFYYGVLGIRGKVKGSIIKEIVEADLCVEEWLYDLRTYFHQRLYNILPETEASIMCAMLLGERTLLDERVRDLYSRNGIIHILSISGLHISIIGLGIFKLMRKAGLSVYSSAIAGCIILIAYGFMTGMSLSAQRAICMYIIKMMSYLLGRTYDLLSSISVVAVIMVLSNPSYLEYSGFLLSFGSVLGAALYSSYLKFPTKHKISGSIIDAFGAGVSISLFTLPIQLYFFYEISIYSVLLNVSILWIMSILMSAGLIIMILPFMKIVAVMVVWILKFIECACGLADMLPGRTWNPGCPGLWQIAVYYLVLFAVVIIIKKWKNCAGYGLIAVALLIVGIRTDTENITFLDVGQGDCIFLNTSHGDGFLFDCGSSSRQKVGENILIPYLKYHGISHLKGVFISHWDKDHYSGILELLELADKEHIAIDYIFLPGIEKEKRDEEFEELLSLTDLPVVYINAGDEIRSGDVNILCLSPQKNTDSCDNNEYSQCFLVETQNHHRIMLTGDIQGEGEKNFLDELIARHIQDVDILKVSHHGSKYSTGSELLDVLLPDMAIISAGEGNMYGHPHKEVVQRLETVGSEVLYTMKSGQITMGVDEEEISVKFYLNNGK